MGDKYYPFYVGDYLRDTIDLNMMEDGAYRRLLDHVYTKGGIDEKRVYKIARASDRNERAAVRSVIERFFVLEDGQFVQNRAAIELRKRRDFVLQQKAKGKARASKAERDARGIFVPKTIAPGDASEGGSVEIRSNFGRISVENLQPVFVDKKQESNQPGPADGPALLSPSPSLGLVVNEGSDPDVYFSLKEDMSGTRKKPRDPDDVIPFHDIIEHLNAKTGKRFNPIAESTRKHIRARWKEGARMEAFVAAIDNQCREWIGTEMEFYLRPATLFNSEKFDGYVNNVRTGKGGVKKTTDEERKQIDEGLAKGREILERMKGEGECLTPSIPKFG